MITLHCVLENGVDLYVNERQRILALALVLGILKKEEEEERRRRMPNHDFFLFARCVRKIALHAS